VIRVPIMRLMLTNLCLCGSSCLAVAQALPPIQQIAAEILTHPNITLADSHVSGIKDSATAKDNITQASKGRPVERSKYGTAPGATVNLGQQMLWGLRMIAEKHKIHVTEIAGGDHSATSRHYVGVAFDLDMIDGNIVSSTNTKVPEIKTMCKSLGATEILGPGDDGHSRHLHCAWKRP
jgi:zinc D-Ala-D-Ala carboxypeptidase